MCVAEVLLFSEANWAMNTDLILPYAWNEGELDLHNIILHTYNSAREGKESESVCVW